MTHKNLELIVNSIVKIADEKKAEDLRSYFVSEKNWMTDYIIVIGVLNKIQSKAILQDIEKYIYSLDNSDDFQIKLLLVFCFYTACRVQEALEVHWDRKGHYNRPMIDLEHRKITLWENKTQRWRTTFIHDKLYNYLSKINENQ